MAGLEGQTFAGYEVLKKLGQGGMGAVYKAHDVNLDRLVALKTLSNDLAQDPEFIARFRREATLAAKLDHPNLIRVFSAGESEGTHYITMELVEGESARDRLAREGRLSLTETLAIGVFVAEALDHAWQHAKLIHRDIKPANIFLSNTGQVKLGDLGLAKSASEASNGLTTTGQAVGTPFYISPEQGRGQKQIDFRADIYSLGCTLYHFITGEPPYSSGDSMAVIHKHIYDPPPPILTKLPNCPMPLVMMLGKMMAKHPNARHQSYTELITEMRRVHYQLLEPVTPPPPATVAPAISSAAQLPPRSHVLAYYVVAVALLAIAGGLWLWEPWKPELHDPPISTTPSRTETPKQTPAPSTASPSAPATSPSTDTFLTEIAALPAEEQVQRVLKRLQQLNPGFDGQAAPRIETSRVIELKFTSAAVTDISPLRALTSLRRLDCHGSKDDQPLTDLSPLRGLQLEALDCGNSQVSDLSPLAGMPLQELRCAHTRVTDLSALKNLPLTRLDIWETHVSDLSPLAGTPLRWLNCKTTRVQDLSPLRDTPLEELHCDVPLLTQRAALLRTISTLKAINGKPATELLQAVATNTPATPPLASAAPPTASRVPVTPATDAESAMTPEQRLARVIARLRQLNPGFDGRETHKTENGAVVELVFSTIAVRDLSPLRELSGLRRLQLSPWPGQAAKGALSDLSPLKGLSLQTLNCANTQVSDLLPLYGMKLEVLQCNNTAVSDLLALEEMPLMLLNCSGTRVTDLSPLGTLSLKELMCDFVPDRDSDLLRGIKTLEKINGLPTPAFWMRLNAMRPVRSKSTSTGVAAKPKPVDDAFIRFVAVLPPEKQVARVMDKLRSLNRGFAGDETHVIENGKVTQFSITATAGLSDLSPLQALASLRNFECIDTTVERPLVDLRPLHSLPLIELKLRHLTVNDLQPLGGMPLEILNLDSCRIPDISSLKGMQLKRLSLWASTVSSLAPVARMPLEWLNCSETKVRDLSPLKGMRLTQLFCNSADVGDLSPLQNVPLRVLRCDLKAAKQSEKALQSIKTLENINGMPAAEFWKSPKGP
ncbi:MAG: protein kinase [Verrucomicrobia bacterium]|nr:protein kinase [Verrucomicrobiota bacterium]